MLLSFLLTVPVIGAIWVLTKKTKWAEIFLFKGVFARASSAFAYPVRWLKRAGSELARKLRTQRQKYFWFFILGLLLLLFLYCNIETVYCLDEETSKKLAGKGVSVNNNVNIQNVNLPDSFFKVLTSIGIAGAVGGGMAATAKVIKTSGGSPIAKLGLITLGGLAGGVTATISNNGNSIIEKKINYTTGSNIGVNNTNDGNNGPSAFSIEPSADIDTVMSFLNANYLLHVYVLYFIWAILILYISNKVVKNDWKLIYIKNMFGERIHSFVTKSFTYTSKSNNFFIVLGWILLILSSIYSLYIANFLVNNIDIISEIVLESKSK
uniref:Uncharacterized protein n=1 Tax=Ophiocordyceps sinensis TaxID=72228 RepID=A0A1W5T0G2_9HYPO|nr:hypothetical protein [Ophiocordyceps sinensis]ARF03400.1 hypothetical protein [Ophiocordyceps sinensis]QDH07248.1 hypothetical protein [Ophiocordyceps sinensis]